MTAEVPLRFQTLVKEHVPAVVELAQSLDGPDVWTESDFYKFVGRKARAGVVALSGRLPVAYALYSRPPGQSRVHLEHVAVAQALRRRGVGRSLIAALTLRHSALTALARESDLPAQLFLAACGLRCNRIVRNAFDCPPEDGYHFVTPA